MEARDYIEVAFGLLGERAVRLITQAGIQELSCNYEARESRCVLFVDTGVGAMRRAGIELDARRVEAAIRMLAASAGKAIEREAPFLNLVLPNGARFSACLPPASDGPTFSIRLHWRAVRPLEDFVEAPWQLEVIDEAILRRDNIVAVGGTSAGKTTLLNALLARLVELFPDERLGIVEDELELRIEASNVVRRIARGAAAATLPAWYRQHPPFEIAAKETIQAEVSSVLHEPNGAYEVRWSETTRNLNGDVLATTHWRALLAIQLAPPDPDKTLSNPIGLYVTEIDWSEEQDS
jgi:hypothetical protein